MKYTEKQLNNMASPISQSEEEKCKNAIKMIRDTMKELNYTDDGKDSAQWEHTILITETGNEILTY